MSKFISLKFFLLLSLAVVISSCYHDRVYEKNLTIKKYEWASEFIPSFTLQIPDTSVLYNIYLNIRHTSDYPFQNIWLVIKTNFPDSSVSSRRVELMLASDEGKWYGESLGDIWDYRSEIQENAFFKKPGLYTFSIEQVMRKDPLPGIMAVGLRLENTGLQKNQSHAIQ